MMENLQSSDQKSFTNTKEWFHPQLLSSPYRGSQSAENQQMAVLSGQSESEMSDAGTSLGHSPQKAKVGALGLGLCSCWEGLARSQTTGSILCKCLMQQPLPADVNRSPTLSSHCSLAPYAVTAFKWFLHCKLMVVFRLLKKKCYSTVRLLEKKVTSLSNASMLEHKLEAWLSVS